MQAVICQEAVERERPAIECAVTDHRNADLWAVSAHSLCCRHASRSKVQTLQGLEMTLEILADMEARSSESLAALGRGEHGADIATVRQDLARRRATGT